MQQQPMNTQQGMYPDQQQNQYRDQQGQNQMNQSSNQYNDQYPQARNMQQQPMNMQQGMYPDQQQHQYRGQQGQGQMNNQGDYERYYGQYPQYRNVSDQDRYIYASGNFRRDTMNYGQEMAPRTMRSESSMENVIFRPQAGDSEELNQYWAMSRPDYVQERESLGDSSDYDSRYYQFPSDPSMGARSMRQDNRQDMSPHSQDNQYQPWQSYNQSYPERGMDSRYVSEHSMRMMDQDLERSRMIAQQRSSAMGSSAESSYMDYNQTVLDKIDQMRDDFKSSRVDLLTRIGESLYDQAEYSAANAVFTEILAIDSANPNAKVRVAQTDAKNKVMLVRSSRVYDYKLLNPASYRNILDQLKKEMDRYALQYPKGEVVFDVNLRFDTMGINRSTYSFDKADVDGVSKRRVKKDFTYFLRDMTKNSALTPSMKEGIKVSSQADLHVDVAWQTKEVIFKVNDSRMKLKTDSEFPRDIAAITNYLDRYDQPNGKYTFALRQKTISKMTYTDIDLVKFNTVGPEAMLYSMLVPGLGNIVATQGEKGWISLSTFFLFGGAGLAAHLLANDQNKRANNYPEGSQEYQNHKDNSKYLRYGSYACFGVSGVVYLADVFTALGRGIKNMRESKELRRSLRDNVIDVQRESIAIY